MSLPTIPPDTQSFVPPAPGWPNIYKRLIYHDEDWACYREGFIWYKSVLKAVVK